MARRPAPTERSAKRSRRPRAKASCRTETTDRPAGRGRRFLRVSTELVDVSAEPRGLRKNVRDLSKGGRVCLKNRRRRHPSHRLRRESIQVIYVRIITEQRDGSGMNRCVTSMAARRRKDGATVGMARMLPTTAPLRRVSCISPVVTGKFLLRGDPLPTVALGRLIEQVAHAGRCRDVADLPS